MSPAKVLHVARREFVATALTKGFIIGALVVPALMVVLIPVIGILAASAKPPAEKGTLLVIDRTPDEAQAVYPVLESRLKPEAIRERRVAEAKRIAEVTGEVFGGIAQGMTGTAEAAAKAVEAPEFRVERLPADADLDEQKERLRADLSREDADPLSRLLAVIEIDADAVVQDESKDELGSYQAFFRPKLNDDAVGEIEGAVDWSIRERRFEAADIPRDLVSKLSSVRARATQEITETGERRNSAEIASFAIPFAAMILILISTFTGGQYLLTTTIEEKSSRVVEVLLSALSPMELMTGKILGQMGVGLSLMAIYNSVGIVALISFSLADLISPTLVISFFVLFVLAYAMFASMMAAIGSAVNDLREAQSLMTPVMLISMIPYFFFMPVIKSPNSTLSTVMSFIPPFSPFIVIMRVASTDPPPLWQLLLSILVMIIGAVGLMWAAAKIFRVGLLMFGKPPNIATLIKWVRMA